MAWVLMMVLLILVVYNSFPLKEEDYCSAKEEKYAVSVSSFWGPNCALNSAPLKPDPAVYLVYHLHHLLS